MSYFESIEAYGSPMQLTVEQTLAAPEISREMGLDPVKIIEGALAVTAILAAPIAVAYAGVALGVGAGISAIAAPTVAAPVVAAPLALPAIPSLGGLVAAAVPLAKTLGVSAVKKVVTKKKRVVKRRVVKRKKAKKKVSLVKTVVKAAPTIFQLMQNPMLRAFLGGLPK